MTLGRESIVFEESPYYLTQAEKGIFKVVHKVIGSEGGKFNCETDPEHEPLAIDVDIREIPLHGISLIVKSKDDDFVPEKIVQTLRDYARPSMFNYISLFPFKDHKNDEPEVVAKILGLRDDLTYLEIRPRAFSLIK